MTDLLKCKRLYSETFNDSGEFCDLLFETNFNNCRYSKAGGEVATMMFTLPCVIETAQRAYNAAYIYAAATDPRFRGQGFMSRLIEDFCSDFDGITFLKPADEGLINFYNRLSFFEFTAVKSENGYPRVCPVGGFAELLKYSQPDGSEYTAMYRYKTELELNGLKFSLVME